MKLVAGLLLLTLSLSVQAGKWEQVAVIGNNETLFVDSSGFTLKRMYKDNKSVIRAMAPMLVITKESERSIRFLSVINAEECVVYNAGELYNIYPGEDTESNISKFEWSSKGTRMVDATGVWLCTRVNELVDSRVKQNKKYNKKYNKNDKILM